MGQSSRAGPLLLQSNVFMAEVHPFRAFRYDPQQVRLDQVVTQPYDKISKGLQDRYYAASPYNLVRIILGRAEETDNPANNVYLRAADAFRTWRDRGILRQDPAQSLYRYSQSFTLPGSDTKVERTGFIALGRIEEYSAGVVYRHEQTLSKPKADRLNLLRATRANFGQLFMLYQDSGEIESLLAVDGSANIEVTDENGVVHRVWQISDADLIRSVCAAMHDKKLIIADGHHRYETALAYRDECRKENSPSKSAPASPAPLYEFAMMTFVNLNSPALAILPTNRVVHGVEGFSEDGFYKAARAFFDIDEVDSSLTAAQAKAMLREAGRAGTCLLAVTPKRAFLMHHPNPGMASVFGGLSLRQQSLDVVQLHKVLLENVLRLSEESIRDQKNVSYVRDPAEALSHVRSGSANIVFLMNPCRVTQVRDIAFAGEVMPQKSTDFYPKLLSGLTIYALD